ncbi:hypothetical protein H6G97_38820 [Nostoc flagelliforme FACHB-838]|uniref:Uncharacterized protein n=1 Tax=Nostoc flagelliforme FACHB-838 TaxID=2692904 RepID=A0ABR8DZZ5_9NOSO|nr:hypothetical protein [Nostoc flagelliforme]MBD2535057.1 hypothetical protein [Nostoc flagelliforme FACHB-838]
MAVPSKDGDNWRLDRGEQHSEENVTEACKISAPRATNIEIKRVVGAALNYEGENNKNN